jgi:hypothetical protein
VVGHNCNTNTSEVEAGGLQVWGQIQVLTTQWDPVSK